MSRARSPASHEAKAEPEPAEAGCCYREALLEIQGRPEILLAGSSLDPATPRGHAVECLVQPPGGGIHFGPRGSRGSALLGLRPHLPVVAVNRRAGVFRL